MEIHTYPEMNAKIVGILRVSDSPVMLYAAQRIEELERFARRVAYEVVGPVMATEKEMLGLLEAEARTLLLGVK